jgi:hypothetical protein
MTQVFLSYPWNSKYPDSSYSSFHGAAAAAPNRPTYGNVTEGSGTLVDSGYIWQHDTGGTADGDTDDFYRRDLGGTGNQRGYGYTYNSNSGGSINKWFDVGSEAGKSEGSTISAFARSSWLKGVTSCWFVTNVYGMDAADDCSATIKQVAIRYVNPSDNKKILYLCENKLAGFDYDYPIAFGNVPTVCGYSLSPSDIFNVKNNGYLFLGFRMHLLLYKSGGVRNRTISFHMTGLTPGFWDSSLSYDKDNKRVICRSSGTTFDEYKKDAKFQIEAR